MSPALISDIEKGENSEKMYTDTGFLYPYFQNFSQEIPQLELEELYHLQKPQSASMNQIFTSPSISDYDLGEGDLFNAPKHIIEEQQPMMGFDPILEPMSGAMSTISSCGGGDDVMLASIEETESEDLLSEVLSECAKDVIIGNNIPTHETQISAEILDTETPVFTTGTNLVQTEEEKLILDSQFQKSVSLECLRSLECASGRLNFLDFPDLDFGAAAAYGMRRAFSEGDIQKLGCSNNIVGLLNPSPLQRPIVTGSCSFGDRQEKLCRYRNKKSRDRKSVV